jgi:hypothetical protein
MRVRKADKTVDDSGTSHVNGDAVGVGAVTGSFIFGPPLSMAIGGGGSAPWAEKGGGAGELLLEFELEGPETGANLRWWFCEGRLGHRNLHLGLGLGLVEGLKIGVGGWKLGLRCGRVLGLFHLISILGRIRSYYQLYSYQHGIICTRARNKAREGRGTRRDGWMKEEKEKDEEGRRRVDSLDMKENSLSLQYTLMNQKPFPIDRLEFYITHSTIQ